MYNEGHIIASHTYTHRDLTTLSDFEIIDEMEKTSQLIYEAIAVKPAYMVRATLEIYFRNSYLKI